MKQPFSQKKIRPSMVWLLLATVSLLSSAIPLSVYAENSVFSGTADAEVEESKPFDLMSGVSAVDSGGMELPVTIASVTCNGEPIPRPTAIITAGPAGTTYCVEYLAATASDGCDHSSAYTTQRTIVSIPAPNPDAGESTLSQDIPESTPPPQNAPESTPLPQEPSPPAPDDPGWSNTNTTAPKNKLQKPSNLPILFEHGIHSVNDPEVSAASIILYCMNSKLAWPHSTGSHPSVPSYTHGYLTQDDFESKAQYDAFLQKLKNLLFSGYPYNGAHLYKLVPENNPCTPSPQEFNQMLIVPSQLMPDFPALAGQCFTLDDITDPVRMAVLQDFVSQVVALYPDKTTPNGLNYNHITSLPFYKAAFSMTYNGSDATAEDALLTFGNLYASSYFVTESQAYDATRNAVWKLMYDYKVEANDLSSLSHDKLAQTLYQHCQQDTRPDNAPSSNAIRIEGDATFAYHPQDGLWHSGTLYVTEPTGYNGRYHLELPESITANSSEVCGREPFELVSAQPPKSGVQLRVSASIPWLRDIRQYSPINSTEFQHMVGAVIDHATVSQSIPLRSQSEGSLEISKIVHGNRSDLKREFIFVVTLPETRITGKYGDLFFINGVARFTLKAGETKTAEHLPAHTEYIVTEREPKNFVVTSTNAEGTISASSPTKVVFENARTQDLFIQKTVEGQMGDPTKPFHFDIKLYTANGAPFVGSFQYVTRSSADPNGQPISEGTLTFLDGKATAILTHGQQLQIIDIPHGYKYTVTEQEANLDGYTTTYNKTQENADGVVTANTDIHVVNRREFVPPTGIWNTGIGGMASGMCLAAGGLAFPVFLGCLHRKKESRHG